MTDPKGSHKEMATVKKTAEIGKGKAGPGRPKGVQNKTTQEAKAAIALVAANLGGAKALEDWVLADKKNEFAFWTVIYPKLLPLQVANADDQPFKTISRIELVGLG
jgi:hypothetical protein